MSDQRIYDWKEEFGDKFSKFDSDTGSNFAVNYPWLIEIGALKQGMSFFSIGGGFGTLEANIAKDYEATFGFLEPTPSLFNLAQARLERFGVMGKQLEKHLMPFQEFTPSRRYDSVFAIHSWYYIALSSEENWGKQVVHALGRTDTFMTYEHLKRWSDQLGIESTVYFRKEMDNLNHTLENGLPTQKTKDWVTYMARKPWAELSLEKQAIVTDLFRKFITEGNAISKVGFVEYRM